MLTRNSNFQFGTSKKINIHIKTPKVIRQKFSIAKTNLLTYLFNLLAYLLSYFLSFFLTYLLTYTIIFQRLFGSLRGERRSLRARGLRREPERGLGLERRAQAA